MNENKADQVRMPVFAGITGHTDVEDEQKLTEQVKRVLIEICGKFKDSPVILLTPLAEGSDRAAANAVIELKKFRSANIGFMVMLPMNEDEYIKTFTDEKSVSAYHFLKSQAEECFIVPYCGSMAEGDRKSNVQLYENLGAYLAYNTQILIAAWNGAEEDETVNGDLYPSTKPGGTYHVLRMRFFGTEEDIENRPGAILKQKPGPVYWIKTKRKSSDYVSPGKPVVGPAYPDVSQGSGKKCIRDFFEE